MSNLDTIKREIMADVTKEGIWADSVTEGWDHFTDALDEALKGDEAANDTVNTVYDSDDSGLDFMLAAVLAQTTDKVTSLKGIIDDLLEAGKYSVACHDEHTKQIARARGDIACLLTAVRLIGDACKLMVKQSETLEGRITRIEQRLSK